VAQVVVLAARPSSGPALQWSLLPPQLAASRRGGVFPVPGGGWGSQVPDQPLGGGGGGGAHPADELRFGGNHTNKGAAWRAQGFCGPERPWPGEGITSVVPGRGIDSKPGRSGPDPAPSRPFRKNAPGVEVRR